MNRVERLSCRRELYRLRRERNTTEEIFHIASLPACFDG